jgi:hypothetical protein
MIRHIVALRLSGASETDRDEQFVQAKARLEALADVVPGVVSIRLGHDLGLIASHWPVVLVADFADNAALEAYQAHPRHVEVLAWLNDGIVVDRATVDYDTEE